jgi:hypothetical protein
MISKLTTIDTPFSGHPLAALVRMVGLGASKCRIGKPACTPAEQPDAYGVRGGNLAFRLGVHQCQSCR